MLVVSLDLGTFGAIMKYALEIENSVTDYYGKAINEVTDPILKELLSNLISRGQKRVQTLERVRRENVTEMILEPIEGLDSDSFEIKTDMPEDKESIKKVAVEIEKTLLEFYNAAAAKIDFLPEAAYAFELLAEKNEATIKQLST